MKYKYIIEIDTEHEEVAEMYSLEFNRLLDAGFKNENIKNGHCWLQDEITALLLCPKCGSGVNIALSVNKKKAHCFHCDHYWDRI